jgi:hypothetical protein
MRADLSVDVGEVGQVAEGGVVVGLGTCGVPRRGPGRNGRPRTARCGAARTLSPRPPKSGKKRAAQLVPARRQPQTTHGTYRGGVVVWGWRHSARDPVPEAGRPTRGLWGVIRGLRRVPPMVLRLGGPSRSPSGGILGRPVGSPGLKPPLRASGWGEGSAPSQGPRGSHGGTTAGPAAASGKERAAHGACRGVSWAGVVPPPPKTLFLR